MSESLLDNLLNDSQTDYLKKTCPSLFDGSGKPNLSYNKILSTDKSLIIPDGIKYYEVVETGNNYVDNLLNEEEKYLKEKYGDWILYDPGINKNTYLLWLLPILIFLFGGAIIVKSFILKK